MKINRIICAFLALVFALSAAISVFPVTVAAAKNNRVNANGEPIINYTSTTYETPQEKLDVMTPYKTQNGYRIYVDEYTGEVAFQDMETGDAIFSNPYDLGKSTNLSSFSSSSVSVKEQLLSQIVLTFKEKDTKESAQTFYSYVEASKRGQITVKNIKNGVRMEYAIGEILITRLVPYRIPKQRFENLILAHIQDEHDKERLMSFYTLYDSSDKSLSETEAKAIEAKFPITRRMPIYVLSTSVTKIEKKQLEAIIKTYCAEFYTLDDMEQDHADTDYYGVEVAPPCFRMALEYTIEDGGLSVRLPANGIRFDESTYELGTVSVLPYMGSAKVGYASDDKTSTIMNDGYLFIPDGAGAIIRYEDIANNSNIISGTMYGTDFAYLTISNGDHHHERDMRYPVFGNVVNGDEGSGFVAIIAEGDSMAEIVARNDGLQHNYAYVFARFTPRPSDTLSLAGVVAGASDTSHTITSKRKYSGSYVIKYKLLTSKQKENAVTYEPSYVGIAKAYRDYLVGEGILTALENTSKDIPLYLEAFGSIEAKSTFLTFPVNVDKELTTFDDVKKIYDELSENDIKNINFKLTGFSNGGLDSTYPAKVKWVSALGGKSGFTSLRDYAAEKGFGVYPDFDFAYVASQTYFDGFSEKTDAVRTIDSRYTSRRYYDAASQSLEDDYAKAVSPSRYPYFAEKFTDSYSDYGISSVSASTLGTALNSDFDQKDPYNREDSKKFTTELLQTLKETYQDVMIDGGNAYTFPYVNHITGVATDSSNYLNASQAVPFAGFVLHGFVNFACEPLNMEGDIDYAFLKALENGASICYTVAYENVNELKESKTYNKYYSVDFEVWKDEIINKYNKLNGALGDLQTALLDSHSYITDSYRIPTESEFASDEAERQAQIE